MNDNKVDIAEKATIAGAAFRDFVESAFGALAEAFSRIDYKELIRAFKPYVDYMNEMENPPAVSYYCTRPVFPPYNAPISYLDGLVVLVIRARLHLAKMARTLF